MKRIAIAFAVMAMVAVYGPRLSAQAATFDAMSYAVAVQNGAYLYEQLQSVKQQVEYAYNTYQTLQNQITTFQSGDYWKIMSQLNGIADSYTRVKDAWSSMSIEVNGKDLGLEDLALAPSELKAQYARILGGDYSTAEQNAALRLFGVNSSMEEMSADIGSLANIFIKKNLTNGAYDSDISGDATGGTTTASEQSAALADKAMTAISDQQQTAVLANQNALLSGQMEEMNRRIGDLGAMLAAQMQYEMVNGKSIDVTEDQKATRQYGLSEEFLAGGDY